MHIQLRENLDGECGHVGVRVAARIYVRKNKIIENSKVILMTQPAVRSAISKGRKTGGSDLMQIV